MTPIFRRIAVAASAALVLSAIGAAPAQADRRDRSVRVRGGFHFGGSVVVRPRFRPTYYRYRPRVVVAPSWYWGSGVYMGGSYYYAEPPPSCYEGCGYYPPPPRVVAQAPAPRPPLPRLGLGVFAGGTALERGGEGNDLGIIGRLRLTNHLLIEGEVAKSELLDGQRVDRTGGASLVLDLAPWSRFSVYLLGGLGAGTTEFAGGGDAIRHVYGEVGAGLDWRIGERVSLIADIRGGTRTEEQSDEPVLRAVGGSAAYYRDPEEGFSRGRLGLLVSF